MASGKNVKDGNPSSASSPSHEMICNFDKISIKSGSVTPVGSGYTSELDGEYLIEDQLNDNPPAQNGCLSQHSVTKYSYSVVPGTFSEMMGHSDSEVFEIRQELFNNLHVIGDAEKAIDKVLAKLQTLWLNIDDKAVIPPITTSPPGQHKLLQLVNLTAFVVKEIESEWNAFIARSTNTNSNKISSVEQSNRLLREQLESSRVIQSCLESELKYLEKEKALLNEEVKELSLQIASQKQMHEGNKGVGFGIASLADNKQEKFPLIVSLNVSENKVNPATQRQKHPDQETEPQTYSAGHKNFNKNQNHDQNQNQTQSPSPQLTQASVIENEGYKSSPETHSSSTRSSSGIRFIGKISTTNIRKRENDFDSIMNFVRARGNAMDTLNTQMEKYDADFQTLQEEIYQVASEKLELHKAYEDLLLEYNSLLKERQSYEGILNLILKEKKGTEESMHQILETLIGKLNAITTDEGSNARFAVLENALQAVQAQNTSYRQEITELKCKLNTTEQNQLNSKAEYEKKLDSAKIEIDDLHNSLQIKNDEINENQKSHQDKIASLQELHDVVCAAKAEVEKVLAEKEIELTKQRETLEGIQKGCTRKQKKLQELNNSNNKMLRETQDQKRSIEQLNTVVSQLRSNLKEQKIQWSERVRAAGEESTQTKEHCRWLQAQIDHLNHQLAECHERIKKFELEKTALTKQVMSAEEERKVVDRKLEELRSALQGDTVLREALMERNEALQIEINRLRRAKLMNIAISKEGDHSEPPSEMSTLDTMSSFASVPPTYYPEKSGKKNRYAAGLASNYPTKDAARNAISAHGSTLSPSHGGSPASLD